MRTHFVESRSRHRATRGGFFLQLLEAFHRSRRREAIRVLRRHRLKDRDAQSSKPVPAAR